MRLFITLIVIALFLQTSFVPLDICILLLISRSLVFPNKTNLILGFSAGLVLGFLSSINLGFYAISFLIIIELVHLINRLPVLTKFWAVVPVTFVMLMLLSVFELLILRKTMNLTIIIIESFLVVPVFLFIKFYEDRFSPAPDKIKLRLR